jgi:hypothetical protein
VDVLQQAVLEAKVANDTLLIVCRKREDRL